MEDSFAGTGVDRDVVCYGENCISRNNDLIQGLFTACQTVCHPKSLHSGVTLFLQELRALKVYGCQK
jgi:hypothetical protein